MSHALTEHPLPGLDETRLERLAIAGLRSLEDVVSAGPAELARVTGFDLDTARALVRVAQGALADVDPSIIEFVPSATEPASKRLARGLRGARDIEHVRSLVRKARGHVGRRPPRPGWKKVHKRVRKQLRKLMGTLEDLQREVLSDGLSRTGLHHLQRELAPIQAEVDSILGEAVRKRRLQRLAKAAKRVRRELEG